MNSPGNMHCTLLWITNKTSTHNAHEQQLLRLLQNNPAIDCHICNNPVQAEAKAEHLGPTVIVQAMHAQSIIGLDLLRNYKQHPLICHIPIILLGQTAHKRFRDYAFFLGCNDYLDEQTSSYELLNHIFKHSQCYIQSLELESTQKKLTQTHQKLHHNEQSLKQSLTHDNLTGLPNRQAFQKFYEREWSRALRETEALSVIIADIDHFKAYNDHYGHQKGDECLKHIAKLLTDTLQRPTDFYARYSGAEFIIILPTTPAKGGIYIAETVRQALEDLHMPHQHTHDEYNHITLSLGLATTSPMLKHKPRDLIRMADQARFEAKKQGRNRLICKSL
ncbi:MAG: diguanylate cyclase [Mariprofundaceae bacterium]